MDRRREPVVACVPERAALGGLKKERVPLAKPNKGTHYGTESPMKKPRWRKPAGLFHIGEKPKLLDNSLFLQSFFKSLQLFLLNLLRNLILDLLKRRGRNLPNIIQPKYVPAGHRLHPRVPHLTPLHPLR